MLGHQDMYLIPFSLDRIYRVNQPSQHIITSLSGGGGEGREASPPLAPPPLRGLPPFAPRLLFTRHLAPARHPAPTPPPARHSPPARHPAASGSRPPFTSCTPSSFSFLPLDCACGG